MTIQEIKERKKELAGLIQDAKTSEELEELRNQVDEINAEVPDEEPKVEEKAPEGENAPEGEKAPEAEAQVVEEKNLIRVGTETIVPIGNVKEERTMGKYDVETRAWAKKVLGRKDFTEEEERALGDAVGTTATTFVESAADAQGINNLGLLIPSSINTALLERAAKESPIWRDIRKLNVNGNVDVPYLFDADDAGWYVELNKTANEGQEYKKITLVGRELAKNIEITWKADQMTVDGFIAFVIDELYEKMFKAKVNAVIYGLGSGSNQPTGITNGLSPITTGATPIDTIADTKATLSEEAKVGAKIYISPLVADAIRYYKNNEGNYPFLAGLPSGIEEDPFLKNTDIVIGNMRNYVFNEQEAIRLDRDINIKGRTVVYSAYQVVDGGAKENAFAYGKYTEASI